jgi:hypothetical protein
MHFADATGMQKSNKFFVRRPTYTSMIMQQSVTVFVLFLGMFAELRKGTTSFALSV